EGTTVAKLDRATLGDFDAFVLSCLLISQHQGQIIVPDFGSYGHPLHMSLIRQRRLTAGVRTLDALPFDTLLFDVKYGSRCTPEDAETLAKYAGLTPGRNEHTEYVQSLVRGSNDPGEI